MVRTRSVSQCASDASTQLDAIFRAFPDLLFSLDAEGQIFDYKAGKTSTFFLPPEQCLGRSMRDILPAEVGSKFDRAVQETLKTGKIDSIEYRLMLEEKECWFEARLVPSGESGVIATLRDISERVRNVEQIQCQFRRLSALHTIDTAITASFRFKADLNCHFAANHQSIRGGCSRHPGFESKYPHVGSLLPGKVSKRARLNVYL